MLVALLFLSGCAVPIKGGFTDVEKMTGERLGQRVHWIQGAPEDALVEQKIDSLLVNELSVDTALQIALLNNRTLQARYEELGIAQADLVQAGLLSNPVFSARARFAHDASSAANTELGVVQSFLDLFMRSARKGLASAQFEETKRRVGNDVVNMASDTKSAYYTLQGAMHRTAMLQTIVEAAAAAAEFAQRQHAAGNISDLELSAQQALYEQTRLDLVASEAQVLEDRERLTRLMGLWGPRTNWRIAGRLPDIPAEEAPIDHLESLAVSRRLDLAAMRWEIEALARARSITVHWRYVPLFDVGVDTEKDADGVRVTGPEISIALPLFDRGQANVAHAEALLRQAEQRMTARAVEIRSEARVARNRLLTARAVAERYRTTLIPLREQIVAESQRFFNFMLIGAYQLLQAKRDEIEAYQGYIEAVRDYWIARSEMERATGGRIPEAPAREP
jgi:cobalt-zinc-cadmium efflux system outer membrane protein